MKKQKQKKSKINKVVLTVSILMALIFPLFSVYSKSLLSKVNYEVEEIKEENAEISKSNEDLKMQVNELASLSNLEEVAKKLGLNYTYNNVKIVE